MHSGVRSVAVRGGFASTQRRDRWWVTPAATACGLVLLFGGKLDCFSCRGVVSPRHGLWKGSTWLNERHMLFAWISLVWVVFTDIYIYLVSTGTVTDLNTW